MSLAPMSVAAALLLCAFFTGSAQAQSGIVSYVTDGDTFRLTSGERMRIANIDAPETQPGQAKCRREIDRGHASAVALRTLIVGKSVTFRRVGRSYNRTVATVRIGGRDVGSALVATGAARPWPRHRPKPDWCRP